MPDKPSVTAKARTFFYGLMDSKKEKHGDAPPSPPAKPEFYNPKTSSPFSRDQTLVSAFNDLSISANKNTSSPAQSPSFVGGFKPPNNVGVVPSGHSPRPTARSSISATNVSTPSPDTSRPTISMPVPWSGHAQSLTMQMALAPPESHVRPHSNPIPPSFSKPAPSSSPSSVSTRPPLQKPASSPATPTKRRKSDVSVSNPGTPGKAGVEQCDGVTKAGKRCSRMIKAAPALLAFNSGNGESTQVPRFCHQHSKELLRVEEFVARSNDGNSEVYVKFDDWIPPYLQTETKVTLRAEMEKARSPSDEEGFIYTFEIRDPGETETIKLKVGRTVNLVKRIDQWGKQCGSKDQILRGFYPRELDRHGNFQESLMKGRLKNPDKRTWCHRLERLVHLELADLASSSIYLDPKWPHIDTADSDTNGTKPAGFKRSNSAGPCVDCGSMHREIFEFKRWKHKDGKEWEELVKPVIERWGKFVELYV